ncbi:MAG: hypothetical protein KQA41_04005, partial [Candidatus Aenigmarchaeota archaeon]|nr:hypothetical protein [Candidatus Aenigmarchaeota archaeon]
MNIKAVEITQNGKKLFVTKIKVKDILEKYRIDIFDPSTNKGYQRELSKQRIRDFSVYVREGFKISPMNILPSFYSHSPVFSGQTPVPLCPY